jgi:acyl carrier protein
MSIDQKLQAIFRDVFENDSLTIDDNFSYENYEDWDSFHQVKLVIAIEEEFEVKFSTEEAVMLTSVQELKTALQAKGIA